MATAAAALGWMFAEWVSKGKPSVLGIASGAVASGLGYAIWYAAIRELPRTHAATVQLSVPVIAAFAGVVLLSEPLTVRLFVASFALLGGVAIVVTRRAVSLKPPTAVR